MNEIRSRLKRLRLIQLLLITFILIFVALIEMISSNRTGATWTTLHWWMAGLALFCAIESYNFRYRFVPRFAAELARNRENPKALKRWEVWQLMTLANAAGVSLYGLVVRVNLDTFWQSAIFYSVGLILLLLWTPRMPV